MLRKIKADTGMQENTFKKMYPTGASPPKFYGLPKIHKKNIPLRPIVSSTGSVTYAVANELARIIKPLIGNSPHHVHNTKQFADEIRKVKLEEGECITSYNVTAFFTSIPVASAWKRYVDDTFVLQHQAHGEEFLQHINTVDPSIQFIVEEAKEDGSIPFLDTIIRPEADGTFTIGMYRKPTHADLCLPWDSNHNTAAKYSVINILSHRAHTICSTLKLAEEELKHMEQVLGQCKYPTWAIKKIFKKHQSKEKKQTPATKHPAKCHIVIPYTQGISESMKNICRKHGVAVHIKGGQTIKNILVSPKDKDTMTNKNSVIYSYTCGMIDCNEEYIGESGRTFEERYKEHLKVPSPIFTHQSSSGHKTTIENFKIIGREENSLTRTIKESMYIMVSNSTLNRNIGKYNLPHIWDKILFTIPELNEIIHNIKMHNNICARFLSIKGHVHNKKAFNIYAEYNS